MEKKTGFTYKEVWNRVHKFYTDEEIRNRKSKTYANSKSGNKNPMFQIGKDHPRYKGVIDDGSGYKLILKPVWFKGREFSKHIYYHHYIFCRYAKINKIPKGFEIHHIDGNPHNNDISNLALLSSAAHTTLHWIQRKRATTIPKGSTRKANVRGSARQTDNFCLMI